MISLVFISLFVGSTSNKMLVRVYDTPQAVAEFDIAGYKLGKWVDVIVTHEELSKLRSKNTEIIIPDMREFYESVKGFYHSYPGFVDTFTQIALNYPNIAKLDTIGVSWEGRAIFGMKISDNVLINEDEPQLLFDGLHHAREWATLEICLFFADTLTRGYGVDPHVTSVVNSREIWIVPCVNPDGYVFSHDGNEPWWRKNRREFPSQDIGVDLNRNYDGSCNGSPWGAWGAVDSRKAHHFRWSQIYCGDAPFSERETQAIRGIVANNRFIFYVTYHSRGEMVIWPWGYTGEKPPDSTILYEVGYNMAQRIIGQRGDSTYDAFQSFSLYPTSGTAKDWVYGYGLYSQGMPIFAYTVETCTIFWPDESNLDQIVRENFKGAIYLCDIADTIRNLSVPWITSPTIEKLDTTTSDYNIKWNRKPADRYMLQELREFRAIKDSAEELSDLWVLEGFMRSDAQAHSGRWSYWSDLSSDMISSMTTQYPLPWSDSLVFWCKYVMGENADYAFVEVSPNLREWQVLDGFTGISDWVRRAYPLPRYKSLFMRFRYTTGYHELGREGFYVDDIYPVSKFDSITTISEDITDTFYAISDKPSGNYWYRVKGYNLRGWGDFSELEDVVVTVGVSDSNSEIVTPSFTICSSNPVSSRIEILYTLPIGYNGNLQVYDICGRMVRKVDYMEHSLHGPRKIVLNTKELASGIYFVVFSAGEYRKSIKVTLIH